MHLKFVFYFPTASSSWQTLLVKGKSPTNVLRYFKFLSAQPMFQEVQGQFSGAQPKATPEKKTESAVGIIMFHIGEVCSQMKNYNSCCFVVIKCKFSDFNMTYS